MDKDSILGILREHEPELREAGLVHLRLFGSVARGESTSRSDVDLLADLDQSTHLDLLSLVHLQNRLTDLLGADVHLSTTNSLRAPMLHRIAKEAFLLTEPDRSHLQDILNAIDEINAYTSGMDLAAYSSDRTTKLVVERLLQILTEAVIRLGSNGAAACPEIDWRDLRDMGNFIRHAYHRIEDEIIWNTVAHRLPARRTAVRRTLTDTPGL